MRVLSPEIHPDAWELQEGILSGRVNVWDGKHDRPMASHFKEEQLAFSSTQMAANVGSSSSSINPLFSFTKVLTLPFLGGGIIDLPPKGVKSLKNSRRHQFVFFVHYGKVAVEVAGTKFSITAGGMWQIPRGNFYKIENETNHPAQLFFAQASENVEPRNDSGLASGHPSSIAALEERNVQLQREIAENNLLIEERRRDSERDAYVGL